MFNNVLSKPATPGDEFLRVVVIVAVVALVIATSAMTLPALTGAYLMYWAWNQKEERRFLRTFAVYLSFALVTLGLWCIVFAVIPGVIIWLADVLNWKAQGLYSIGRNIILPYWIVSPLLSVFVLSYLLRAKLSRYEVPYIELRGALLRITYPIRVAGQVIKTFAVKGLVGIAVGFFVAIAISMVVIGSIEMAFALLGLKFFGSFLGASYLVLGLYSLVAVNSNPVKALENGIKRIRDGKGILLGTVTEPVRTELVLDWGDINKNIHILGQPGAGKSVLLRNFYSYQILQGEGLMLIDLKADVDVKSEVQGLIAAAKREKDLLVIDLSDPNGSVGYNPLLRGDADELKDKIMSSFIWSEEFYKKFSERALSIVLRALVAVRDADIKNEKVASIPTILDLSECLRYPEAVDILAERLPESCFTEREELREFKKDLKDKDTYAALEGIRTDLYLMATSAFGKILLRPQAFDIYDAILSKKVILVNLNGQKYDEAAKRLGRLLIADLKVASGAIAEKIEQEKRPKFAVIIDEVADIISNEEMGKTFAGFLSRSRGSGLGFIIAHQSLGDFSTPEIQKRILDCTNTVISFVQKDPESCDTLASIAGSKETLSLTEQTDTVLFMKGRTGRGTQKTTLEYIFHPNDFKSLGVGEAIYVAKSPNRYGKLKVKMMRAPKLTQKLADKSWQDRDPALSATLLNLQSLRLNIRNLSALGAENKDYSGRFADAAAQADI